MGVKDLWTVLSPVSMKKTVYELQGKKIAIDLSCWVCEGQSIGENYDISQPRMYLRNVYFRTQTLLLHNVTPIFILEGDAPDLKLNAMKQRNNTRFKYRNPTSETHDGRRKCGRRTRFKGLLTQCQKMLELMGVTCIQSVGEAEALCGLLNKDGFVDGVITQDSDIFLYGARTVYRNFTIKAGTGTVDEYLMSDIEEKLNLNRKKLIAMSLLCGCDYDQSGVHGIGKEMASRYVMGLYGDVLQRLKDLRSDKKLLRYESEKNNCTKCCHDGKLAEHRKGGCDECGVAKGCIENNSCLLFKNLPEEEQKFINLELSIRRRILAEDNFPSEETINEYLLFSQEITHVDGSWRDPDVVKFSRFCERMLEWDLDYSFEKILPLLTRCQLLHHNSSDTMKLVPIEIAKKRVVKGVPSYDIIWNVNDENIKDFLTLLSDNCSVVIDQHCKTTEPLSLICQKMASLYETYEESTKKKKNIKKKTGKPKKADKQVDALLDSLASLCVATSEDTNSKSSHPLSLLTEDNVFASSPISTAYNFSLDCADVSIIHSKTPAKCDTPVKSSVAARSLNVSSGDFIEKDKKSLLSLSGSSTLNKLEDSFHSSLDESTVSYDISQIVNDIVSRKKFY